MLHFYAGRIIVMKFLFFVFFLLITINLFAQHEPIKSLICNFTCLKTVKRLLETEKAGFSDGFLDKQNFRLGDKVAFALREIYRFGDIASSENIKAYLPIVKNSFVSSTWIKDDVDKKPLETLKLLREVYV